MKLTSQHSFASPLEKIPVEIFPHARKAGITVARQIAELIRVRAIEGKQCVLGLATGSTPVGIYNELIRMHQEEGLSFSNVVNIIPCDRRNCRVTFGS